MGKAGGWLGGALVLVLLAGCQVGGQATPPPPLGASPTPVVNVGPPSAAQATTTAALATAQARALRSGPKRRLWLVTGGTGGAEELFGRGIAQSITDKFVGYESTVEVSTGSRMNLLYLSKRQADLALVTVDAAAEARTRQLAEGAATVRSLATLYTNYLHLVTLDGSSVASIGDLRGRVVAVGSPDSSTEFLATRVLAAAGLSAPGAVVVKAMSPGEATFALRERAIDAFFWLGPVPAEPIKALTAQPGGAVRLVPLDTVTSRLMAAHGGVYRAATIPLDTYAGQQRAVPTVVVDTVLVASDTLDEQVTYGVTKAMFENIRELPFFHPEARRLTLLTALEGEAIPLHPGAARFYREKGVLPG
jgi:TRAP transporter TAXI family solute receptor